MNYRLALIHSPLVGPFTWSLVAAELAAHGVGACLPELSDRDDAAIPYCQQHAQAVADYFKVHPSDEPIILVAHSGSGPLLPAIREAIGAHKVDVAAYVFVDAGIPIDGHSRLDMMALESPEWAAQFRQYLESGGHFPNWSDEQLCEVIPDPALRQRLLADLRPRGWAFFTESIPVFQGWPDAPCGYIRLSPAYDHPSTEAQRCGWVTAELLAGHFHMLVNPQQVAELMWMWCEGSNW